MAQPRLLFFAWLQCWRCWRAVQVAARRAIQVHLRRRWRLSEAVRAAQFRSPLGGCSMWTAKKPHARTDAVFSLDGNSSTFWQTQWCPVALPYPHEIQIDLGQRYFLN